MAIQGNEAPRFFAMILGAIALHGCSTLSVKTSDQPDFVFQARPVETIGETISREQQSDNGCLVAGNLNKGRRCRALTELLTPSTPFRDPEL